MKEYGNYMFDLYGTLVDVHTDEENELLWQPLQFLLGMDGIHVTAAYLREKYASQVKERECRARQERGPWAEIDIAPVFASIYIENGKQADKQKIADLAKTFRLLSLEKLRLFSGVEQLMQRLRNAGKKVYLLSNAQALFTMPELKALELEQYFDGIMISSEEGLKKPDKNLYHMALERYNLAAEETVMIGNDDQADCWGAANAGLDSMYVFTEQSPPRKQPLPGNCRLLKTIGDVF